MPKTTPTAAIQNGVVGGSERPKSAAVTQTAWEILPFLAGIMAHSARRANTQDTATRASTRQPNRYTAAAATGISA